MATFTNRATRLLTLSTPLGEDVLLLTRFAGQEAISRLFSYQLEMLSEDEDVNPADIVGKNVTWGVQEWDKETRWFNGHVLSFAAGAARMHDRRVYRMEVVPYFWFLTRTANCRIFQHQKTPDILQRIFKDYGLKNYELSLKRSYPEWEYCVQYRETAFNFAARLMEHEGIFWYFKHQNGKHILVLADHKGAYKDVPDSPVDFLAGTVSPNHVSSWEHRYAFRTGKWAHTDYNFKTPSTNLLTSTQTIIKVPGMDKFEIFDYPGEYPARGDGQADVRIRMEEEEAAHDVVTAASGCPMFSPGFKFALKSHEIEAENGKNYLITAIQHAAVDTSEDQSAEIADYQNSFTCIPAEVIFRPQRLTPKPTVQGPQTAVVVGPAGEEIYTDEHGRIKVQFHWDRYGKKDENSSCWMRVSQNYAGKDWGLMCIPRVGQEVIVDFLEGDPDQPLITGRVYNAEVMPPYPLPGKKMLSGLKSNSYPGGDGYNELVFDDTKGNELIRVHGQFDMDTTIEHDDRQKIKNDRAIEVDGTHTETIIKDTKIKITKGPFEHDVAANTAKYHVKGDLTENYDSNKKTTVGADRTTTVRKNEKLMVQATRATTISGEEKVNVKGNRTEHVGKGHETVVIHKGNRTVSVDTGHDTHNVAKGDQTVNVAGGKAVLNVKVGNRDVNVPTGVYHVDANKVLVEGQEVTIAAVTSLTLTCGGGVIQIDAGGNITIKGPMVYINC